MSQENVETVLRLYDAFANRDPDTMFAEYDPDIEWSMEGYPAWAGARSYRGHEGIQTFFRDWLADFDDYEAAALDPVAVGDSVVITVHDRARGRGSGVPIERNHAQIWTFRHGRVSRIEVFDSREAALAAVSEPEGG